MFYTPFTEALDIHIYDSMLRSPWLLQNSQQEVSVYCCGPTVYDVCHIGHAKAYLSMDIIVRFLLYRRKKVNYVRNITDIDDKIINAAKAKKQTYKNFIQDNIQKTKDEFACLNLLDPNQEPRVTDYIPEILSFIDNLSLKGMTINKYDGVYFNTKKLPDYGKLSNQIHKFNEQKSRLYGRYDSDKDFVLWKFTRDGEPYFESHLGRGRPGWHIECSTMILHTIGKTVDIHAGGCDLLFPHHENELAQSSSRNECPLARCWMHFGLVQDENRTKVSKSLGNTINLCDITQVYSANHVRLMILMSHYRSHLVFSWKKLSACSRVWNRIQNWIAASLKGAVLEDVLANEQIEINLECLEEFELIMANNFNFARAYSFIHQIIKEKEGNIANGKTLILILRVLGFSI